MNPAATAYLQLGAAIVVEVAATAFLKQSDGMSRLLPTVASLLGYGIFFLAPCRIKLRVRPRNAR